MAKNDCPHNSGITCPEGGRNCPTCGWSPEGEKRRRGPKPNVPMEKIIQVIKHKGGRPRQVVKVDESGAVLDIYPSLLTAADANHISSVAVKNHCKGKLKHPFRCTGGYTFHYADEMQEDGA